jgi:hypothetical protein
MRAREALSGDTTFLTPGGTETYLLFQQGFPLRSGCAFEVLDDDDAWDQLRSSYLEPILAAAAKCGHGVLLDTLVWRAHPDFIARLGYPPGDLARFNELAVARVRDAVAAPATSRSAAIPGPSSSLAT